MNINKIREKAKTKGIKISYICNQLGLKHTYLSDVANGKNKMTPERLAIIADILDTTPAYLNDETDDAQKPAITMNDELLLKLSDPVNAEFWDLYLQLTSAEKKMIAAQIKGLLSNR